MIMITKYEDWLGLAIMRVRVREVTKRMEALDARLAIEWSAY